MLWVYVHVFTLFYRGFSCWLTFSPCLLNINSFFIMLNRFLPFLALFSWIFFSNTQPYLLPRTHYWHTYLLSYNQWRNQKRPAYFCPHCGAQKIDIYVVLNVERRYVLVSLPSIHHSKSSVEVVSDFFLFSVLWWATWKEEAEWSSGKLYLFFKERKLSLKLKKKKEKLYNTDKILWYHLERRRCKKEDWRRRKKILKELYYSCILSCSLFSIFFLLDSFFSLFVPFIILWASLLHTLRR